MGLKKTIDVGQVFLPFALTPGFVGIGPNLSLKYVFEGSNLHLISKDLLSW